MLSATCLQKFPPPVATTLVGLALSVAAADVLADVVEPVDVEPVGVEPADVDFDLELQPLAKATTATAATAIVPMRWNPDLLTCVSRVR
jgi:hypothetical protein